jgi:hypothetical protein
LFERLFYHQESKHALRSITDGNSNRNGKGRRGSLLSTLEEDREGNLESQEEEMVSALGTTFNFRTLHVRSPYLNKILEKVRVADEQDEQFALYATANVALVHLTNALNELHLIVRELVGEKELEGFQIAQERWAGLERGS